MALDPITGGLNLIGGIVDAVSKANQKDLEALKVSLKADMEVHKTNQQEAGHPSVFVAGWRPFIGWTCGVGICYAFLLQPLLSWASTTFGITAPPALDTGVLTSIVAAMLGMGGMRMYEGLQGVKRSTWGNNENDEEAE